MAFVRYQVANGFQELLASTRWVWLLTLRVEKVSGREKVLHSNIIAKAHTENVAFV
jgi:hypothetical protein